MLTLMSGAVNSAGIMKKIGKRPALGVDRGGTSTRLVLISGSGAELKRAVFPTCGFRNLPALIIRIAEAWELAPDVPAVIATRGALTRKWKKPFLLKKLKGRLNLLDVISDAQAAYLAAHGDGSGALLIAGTGSVVFLKGRGGRFRKIGGHSPASGDPGSGLWLGTRFLRAIRPGLKGLDRRSRAAYAEEAVKKAEQGDRTALRLVREAQGHLSDLLAAAVKDRRGAAARFGSVRLRSPQAAHRKPLKVALTGGLMKNAFFRKNFIALARARLAPARLAFIALKRPAEYAAAKLAQEKYHG